MIDDDDRGCHTDDSDGAAAGWQKARAELRQAVEQVYVVFADHRRPERIDYCTHCVTHEEAAVLQRVPLRDLSGAQLGRYAWKSGSTWGDEDAYRHFLPRVLDLLFHDELDDSALTQTLMMRLAIHWRTWPAAERTAIIACLLPWWRVTLARYIDWNTAYTVLEAIAETGVDLDEYLGQWHAAGGEEAARNLANFLDFWRVSVDQGRPWDLAVRDWVCGPIPEAVLRAAIPTASSPEVAAELAAAAEAALDLRTNHDRIHRVRRDRRP